MAGGNLPASCGSDTREQTQQRGIRRTCHAPSMEIQLFHLESLYLWFAFADHQRGVHDISHPFDFPMPDVTRKSTARIFIAGNVFMATLEICDAGVRLKIAAPDDVRAQGSGLPEVVAGAPISDWVAESRH